MHRIEMTCPCGATFKAEGDSESYVGAHFREWLAVHREHARADPLRVPDPYRSPLFTPTYAESQARA